MMEWIAITALLLALVQLAVALVNLWSRPWLPRHGAATEPLVSVLIPARNEAANIGNLLGDLSQLPTTNLEILVFDDLSDDDTAAMVEEAASGDPRIRLLRSPGLPGGWTGKNFGCHTLAAAARGDYFLFLDADVRVSGDLVGNAVAAARQYQTGLISLFPQQVMVTKGEKWSVPVMNYILVTLLPLILVRLSRRPSLAAANGQMMFFDAAIYRALQPHSSVRQIRVEDITIARMLKKKGVRVACLLGDERIRCRMYHGYKEAIRGFSRSVTAFFGDSSLVALLFWLLTTFGFLPILLTMGIPMMILWFLLSLATRLAVARVSRQNGLLHLAAFPMHQLSMGLFIFKAFYNKMKREFEWKGRRVS